jgi:hypothetical protein
VLSGGEADLSPGVTATCVYDHVEVVIEQPWARADFEPGGFAYEQALAAGKLYVHPSDWMRSNSPNLEPIPEGLHVVYGNINLAGTLDASSVNGPVTFAATGSVSLSADNVVLDAYTNDPKRGSLLVYSDRRSTNCGQNGITISSSYASWNGDLVAPFSGIDSSHAESTSFGKMYGGTIKLAGSGISVNGWPRYKAIEYEFHLIEKSIYD